MTVVFPFHTGDAPELKMLLRWIGVLGGCPAHEAVLCADAAVDFKLALEIKKLADPLFKKVAFIATPEPVTGWPEGPNSLFRYAAIEMANQEYGPWLWMEPDCIPLKYGWIDALEKRYNSLGVRELVLGAIIPCNTPGLPSRHVSGCAIYPEDFAKNAVIEMGIHPEIAFDLAIAEVCLSRAYDSDLFHCFWGEKGLAPTFVEKRTATHHFTLDQIRPQAVLWHRNKDGSLIRLLAKRDYPQKACLFGPEFERSVQSEFIVVLPFNNKDAPLAIECLKWMKEMGQIPHYQCLLAWDQITVNPFISQAYQLAPQVFAKVQSLIYPAPKTTAWPQAPNWAFQQVARHIRAAIGMPWLWKEADMIPLKPDWIEQLQAEYSRGGKPFMGSIVPGMGHANGTAVYPPDMPSICPRAMTCTDEAFDTAMSSAMVPRCHNAIRLMAHCWGISGGKPHPQIGEPAVFTTPDQIREWINPEAVTFHRCKNTSLIEQFRKIK